MINPQPEPAQSTIEPVRVMHLITGLSTGGAETMLAKLVTRMDRQCFQSVVVSMTGPATIGREIMAAGIDVRDLKMRRGLPNPMALVRLLRLLRHERPHVVMTWLYHADLLGMIAAVLGASGRLIWNLRCSTIEPEYYRGFSGLILGLLARRSRVPVAVVVNSLAGRDAHAALGYAPRQWHLIPNGFDLSCFRPDAEARISVRDELSLPPDAPLIGFVARYEPIKDHASFLRAAARARESRQDMHFVLVGSDVDTANRSLNMLARDLGLTRNLHMLGRRSDVPRLTAAFDIACSTSLGEGFPNILGEAMACGVPPVVTDVGDCAAIVGEAGRIVPPGDPAAMAAAWLEVLALAPEQRQKLGQAARHRVEANFDLDSIVARYQDLLTETAVSTPVRQ